MVLAATCGLDVYGPFRGADGRGSDQVADSSQPMLLLRPGRQRKPLPKIKQNGDAFTKPADPSSAQ